MVAAGILAAIMREGYDALFVTLKTHIQVSKKKEKAKKAIAVALEWIGEILFFTAIAIAAFSFLYYCCYGKISFHALLSFVAGVLLWKKFFYGIIQE